MDATAVSSTSRPPRPHKSGARANNSVKTSNVRPLRRPTPALLAAIDRSATSTAIAPSQAIQRSQRPTLQVRRIDSRTKKLSTLQHDVERLRAEVARLLELKNLLHETALHRADNSTGSACRMVKQYFDVFQLGYVPAASASKRLAPSPQCTSPPDEFLFSMMDEEVVGGGFTGVDVMIEQWKRYGAAFAGFNIKFLRAEVSSVDIDEETGIPSRVYVTASAYYSSHLLLKGVEAMFPHVMASPALVMSLIGQVIGGLGSYQFVYDCTRKRFVEMVIDIDMVAAFAKVVTNAHDLGILFGSALLTSQYYMGDDLPEKATPLAVAVGVPVDQPQSPTSSSSSTVDEEYEDPMSLGHILCGEDIDFD